MHARLILLFGAAAGCASGEMSRQLPDGDRPIDAPSAGDDAAADPDAPGAPIDGPGQVPIDGPPPASGPVALLLTEVVLAPTGGELIEIANPSDQPVSLASYYLADTGLYFRLPAGAPTLDATDFIAKFPSGAMIGPRGVVTVAIDTAAAFQSTYGVAPTYSVADGTMQVVAGTGATLTNAGELIALFWWDGQDDRVRDVDLLLAGVPTTANGLVDKSGVAIDGPDADAIPTAYLPDARTMTAQASTPGSGKSTQRILVETGHEIQAGTGNGLTGHDETSENTSATWDSTFGTPTPGVVPPTLLP